VVENKGENRPLDCRTALGYALPIFKSRSLFFSPLLSSLPYALLLHHLRHRRPHRQRCRWRQRRRGVLRRRRRSAPRTRRREDPSPHPRRSEAHPPQHRRNPRAPPGRSLFLGDPPWKLPHPPRASCSLRRRYPTRSRCPARWRWPRPMSLPASCPLRRCAASWSPTISPWPAACCASGPS